MSISYRTDFKAIKLSHPCSMVILLLKKMILLIRQKQHYKTVKIYNDVTKNKWKIMSHNTQSHKFRREKILKTIEFRRTMNNSRNHLYGPDKVLLMRVKRSIVIKMTPILKLNPSVSENKLFGNDR